MLIVSRFIHSRQNKALHYFNILHRLKFQIRTFNGKNHAISTNILATPTPGIRQQTRHILSCTHRRPRLRFCSTEHFVDDVFPTCKTVSVPLRAPDRDTQADFPRWCLHGERDERGSTGSESHSQSGYVDMFETVRLITIRINVLPYY